MAAAAAVPVPETLVCASRKLCQAATAVAAWPAAATAAATRRPWDGAHRKQVQHFARVCRGGLHRRPGLRPLQAARVKDPGVAARFDLRTADRARGVQRGRVPSAHVRLRRSAAGDRRVQCLGADARLPALEPGRLHANDTGTHRLENASAARPAASAACTLTPAGHSGTASTSRPVAAATSTEPSSRASSGSTASWQAACAATVAADGPAAAAAAAQPAQGAAKHTAHQRGRVPSDM